MEAVHILGRINSQQASLGVQAARQGQLQQNAVHIRAAVAFMDQASSSCWPVDAGR